MSSFQQQIDELKKQVDNLEKIVKDSLDQIRNGIQEVESTHLRLMQEQVEQKQQAQDNKVFLSDVITKDKLTDFGKSLSLNERFMFQREIFQNDANCMKRAMEALNEIDNLGEALNYLNSNFPILWESEAGTIFRELLEKRFV
jgi:hypothetical protein